MISYFINLFHNTQLLDFCYQSHYINEAKAKNKNKNLNLKLHIYTYPQ